MQEGLREWASKAAREAPSNAEERVPRDMCSRTPQARDAAIIDRSGGELVGNPWTKGDSKVGGRPGLDREAENVRCYHLA